MGQCRASHSRGYLAVDVPRQIEVVFVILDIFQAHLPGIARHGLASLEHIYDPVDVAFAQAVFGAVFHEVLAGVDHEDAGADSHALGSERLVDDDDAGRDAGAIKQVGRQANDGLDVALADVMLPSLQAISSRDLH